MATDAAVERARAWRRLHLKAESFNEVQGYMGEHYFHWEDSDVADFAAEENKALILTIRKKSDMFRAQGRGGLAAELDELAGALEAERKREG